MAMRECLDEIGLRLVHPFKELPRIRTERFNVAPLTFRVECVKGEARLPAAAGPGDDNQPPERKIEVYVAKVILARTADAYTRRHRPLYD
jgi:hypothetical protein